MTTERICVCTTNGALGEPRAPRHAAALAKSYPHAEVIFVDCAPEGTVAGRPKAFDELRNIRHQTCFFAHRGSNWVRLGWDKLHVAFARMAFRFSGRIPVSALTARAAYLLRMLRSIEADLYIGHNIDALLPVYHAARQRHVPFIFDCMEFYSEMGDSQRRIEQDIIRKMERTMLSSCSLVTTSSPQVADALRAAYGIHRLLPLYNAPEVQDVTQVASDDEHYHLYWRNAVIGLGQRGLDDALLALSGLPNQIRLHLQGRLPQDGGRALKERIRDLGLVNRVAIHPPFAPHEAVLVAANYDTGLCLERPGIRNQDLTVSNKLFDYLMAGLPVICSALPGLREVVTRSRGGILFQSGQPDDLAEKILFLYEHPKERWELAQNARKFALAEGNCEREMAKFTVAVMGSLSNLSAVR